MASQLGILFSFAFFVPIQISHSRQKLPFLESPRQDLAEWKAARLLFQAPLTQIKLLHTLLFSITDPHF
jgi:hypothetical protein